MLLEKEGSVQNNHSQTILILTICNDQIERARLFAEKESGISKGTFLDIARQRGNEGHLLGVVKVNSEYLHIRPPHR